MHTPAPPPQSSADRTYVSHQIPRPMGSQSDFGGLSLTHSLTHYADNERLQTSSSTFASSVPRVASRVANVAISTDSMET